MRQYYVSFWLVFDNGETAVGNGTAEAKGPIRTKQHIKDLEDFFQKEHEVFDGRRVVSVVIAGIIEIEDEPKEGENKQ